MLFETDDSPPRRSLRGLLAEHDLVYAVGVWDGASAAIAESVGIEAVMAGGWMITGALGLPDADLYSKTQALDVLRAIASRTSAAVVADMEAGFGSASHTYHALQAYEKAGASAVLLDDQVSPQLSYVAERRPVYDIEIATGKIRAAVEARRDPSTMLIARTDAVGEEVYRRGEAYATAGADMILPTDQSPEFDAAAFRRLHEVAGVPLVAAPLPGTAREREFTPDVLREIGVRFVPRHLQPFNVAMTAIRDVYRHVKSGTPIESVTEGAMTTQEFAEIIGLYEAVELENRFSGTPATATGE